MTAKAALPHAIHKYGETERSPRASPVSSPTALSVLRRSFGALRPFPGDGAEPLESRLQAVSDRRPGRNVEDRLKAGLQRPWLS